MYSCYFKNESCIMKEWLEHYIKEGVQKFFLIDNGSNDNYFNILVPYIEKDIVELVVDSTKHKQNVLYNYHFKEKCKKYEWVLICDLDEFVYSRKNFKTIPEYLITLDESTQQIVIPWKIFGSSGCIVQPEQVVSSFVRRQMYSQQTKIEVKSITRTKAIFKLELHKCYISRQPGSFIDYTSITSEDILTESFLHLNHYQLQSLEWFTNVKCTRGDSFWKTRDNMRNKRWFIHRDKTSNVLVDTELKCKHVQ